MDITEFFGLQASNNFFATGMQTSCQTSTLGYRFASNECLDHVTRCLTMNVADYDIRGGCLHR
ncbi:MAG: hypothetical protein IPI16_17745 [Comamonadaceae bacterium]|nr:hypothetical protein [Comamonadaceae bacterium]